jgi:hypothetical protein
VRHTSLANHSAPLTSPHPDGLMSAEGTLALGGVPALTICVVLEWPLVGRAEELRFVAAAMRPRLGSQGLVLAGALGVGKSRLAREALAEAERRGVMIHWAAATASSHALPFGAFAGLLGDIGPESAQVLPRAAATLLADAGRAGVVVGIDDAHLLDELSATLVHHLVLRREATVLVTVRTGEPAPDAVTALWKDRHLERLEVQPLSEAEIARLLEAVLGGQVYRGAVNRLWTMSQGTVLYLRHLVDGAVEAAALRHESGVWCLAEFPRVTLGLVELITARMGALSEPVRAVLDILALSEPLDTCLLAELTEPAAVEQAEDCGVVRVEMDGWRLRARLAHPLYGEVRRGEIGQLRARRLRGRIAAALSEAGAPHPDNVLRQAVLMAESDLEPDAALLVAGAERATHLADLPLAQRLAQTAVQAGGGFSAQAIVANATAFIGHPDDADAALAVLAQLAGDDHELVRALVNRATFLAWMRSRPGSSRSPR